MAASSKMNSVHSDEEIKETIMIDASEIQEHAEVVGADGEHVGTVDHVDGDRIKLTKADSGAGHEGHHHYLGLDLVDRVEDGIVRLSVNKDVALLSEEEQDGADV
jgi:hypothetical protein